MSVLVTTWVFHQSPATGNDRLVLLALADEADDDGRNARPSVRRLAKKARIDRSTVIRAVVRLEGAGQLLVSRPETKGRGRFNRYVVVMGRDPKTLAAEIGWPAPALSEAPPEWATVDPAEWSQSATIPDLSEGSVSQAAPGATIARHSLPGSEGHSRHSLPPVDNPAAPPPFSDRPPPPPRDPDAAERVRSLRRERAG